MAKDYAAPKSGFIKDPETTLKVATPRFGFVTYAPAPAGGANPSALTLNKELTGGVNNVSGGMQ